MPSEGTRRQSFRLDQETWDEFGAVVALFAPSSNRSDQLQQFVRWFLHEPGMKSPKRPTREQMAEIRAQLGAAKAPASPDMPKGRPA